MSTTLGSAAIARATPTRWLSPPDSWRGRQLQEVEEDVDAGRHAGAVPPEQTRRDTDILGHAHVRKQPDALKHETDAAPQRDRIHGPHVLALEADDAFTRVREPVDQGQQRALARSRSADDRQELALVNDERDAVERFAGGAGIGLADVLESDRGRHPRLKILVHHLFAGAVRHHLAMTILLQFHDNAPSDDAERRFTSGVPAFCPMSSVDPLLTSRAATPVARRGVRPILVVAALHLAALLVMATTEVELVQKAAFLLAWGVLNCFWLVLLRRPALSAALSLVIVLVLILLSQFKHDKLLMTVNFVDVMVIDTDTFAFLLTVFPALRWEMVLAAVLAVPALVALWRLDPFRIRRPLAAAGVPAFLAGLTALSLAAPAEFYDEFFSQNYVSKFARSGVAAVSDFATRGYMESDASVTERLSTALEPTCRPAARPHIIMLFDESSFDITAAPGMQVPPGYKAHFKSFDG
jgi:hypothetical protein